MRQLITICTFVVIPAISTAQQAPALRIVVLEGEGAVNIIQQKTAVRPLVEIRDANNLPVPGATVTFTIGSGQPAVFAGGTQTLTVTTGATGQAAASGLNATGSGAVTIQVQAAHQGRLATTAITQTNFATAAAAAAAGAAVQASGAAAGTTSGAGAAAGAGGGGGGGLSATTIAIVGAAVGGGAAVATQVGGQQDSDSDVIDTFNGTVNGQIAVSSSSGTAERPINCTHTRAITGSLQINLRPNGTGTASMQLTITPASLTGACIPETTPRPLTTGDPLPVTGGPSAITFSYTSTTASSDTWRFTGALSGNTIAGTLTYQVAPLPNAGSGQNFTGSTSMPVTLTGPRP